MPPKSTGASKPILEHIGSRTLKPRSSGNRRSAGHTPLSEADDAVSASTTADRPDAELHEHAFALEILLRKLKGSQPSYFDEDVVNPQAELSSSTTSGSSLPSAVELQFQHQLAHLSSGHLHGKGEIDGRASRRGSPTQRNGGDFPSTNGKKEHKTIMEVTEALDVAQLGKSRRCLMDLIKLLQSIITFVLGRANSAGALHAAEERESRDGSTSYGLSPRQSTSRTSIEAAGVSSPRGRRSSKGPSSAVAPALWLHPPLLRRCVVLLDEVIQSVLVYANESEPLRSAVRYDRDLVIGMCAVCLMARQIELQGPRLLASGDEPCASPSAATTTFGRGRRNGVANSFTTLNGSKRSADTLRSVSEVKELQEWLQKQHMGVALSKSIADIFALEMLLDSALPPAVCSSRFDGMTSLVWESKALFIGEVLAARGFLSAWMKKAAPFYVLRMAIMGLYAPPRSRAKLYDKMVAEGLLYSVEERVSAAVASCKHSTCGDDESRDPHEAIGVIHDCLDVLLCLTAPTGDDGEQAASPAPSKGTDTAANDDAAAPDSPVAGPRGASRGATAAGVCRGVGWSTHIGSLRRIARELASLANIIAFAPIFISSAMSSSQASNGSQNEDDTPGGQRQLAQQPAAAARTELCRPPWLTAIFADKICECLFQIAKGSRELLHMIITDVLDKLFDSVTCHAAGMLLPLLLNIVDAVKKSGETSTTSAEDSSRIDMIADWFSTAVCADFVPWLFEHRRPQWTLGRIISSLGTSLTSSASRHPHVQADALPSVGHVTITRHLSRTEEHQVTKYLDFGKRLVRDTTWREGTSGFLQKVLVVAKSVWVTHSKRPAHRRALIAGLAVECIHVIAPLIQPLQRESSLLQTLLRTDSRGAAHSQKRERSEDPPPLSPPPPLRVSALLLSTPNTQDVLLPSPAARVAQVAFASPQSPTPRALLSEFEGTSLPADEVSPPTATSRGLRRR